MGRAFRTQASLACCNILIANCRYQDDVGKEVKEESFRLDASAERQLLRKILFCGAVVVDTVGILVFTRSFAPAVLVQLGMFTHSKLRRGISGACGLVRAGLSQAA
jgi:hypothetical protein